MTPGEQLPVVELVRVWRRFFVQDRPQTSFAGPTWAREGGTWAVTIFLNYGPASLLSGCPITAVGHVEGSRPRMTANPLITKRTLNAPQDCGNI